MEPFTTNFIQLQGGKFDNANHISDIGNTWNSVLQDMSDVKELVGTLFMVTCTAVLKMWCLSLLFTNQSCLFQI